MNTGSMTATSSHGDSDLQSGSLPIVAELQKQFGPQILMQQTTADLIPTVWVQKNAVLVVLNYLKILASCPYQMLFDLTAIDERRRAHRDGQPKADFTVVYHLVSFTSNTDIRIKVPLVMGPAGDALSLQSIVRVWPNANWYEREVWDLFGIRFEGHPNLQRIMMPRTWQGHPLRKDHVARATEMEPFSLPTDRQIREQEALRFDPEEWGMERERDTNDFMFLNLGPNHPSVHGVFRIALQLDGEEVVDAVPDIGYHHRGAEKMGERQAWHSFVPYTDRVDYLGGVMNNFPYVMAIEKMAGIEVPPRAQCIRVMTAEMFRIASHLVFYGTFAQDVGQLSPIFYMFIDREKLFGIVEAFTGARMHPSWFRIGGVAQDLPKGWDDLIRDFIDYLPKRLDEYEDMVLKNSILKKRTRGIGVYNSHEALDWGVTGPGLRATGLDWDLRKVRPYSGYDQYEFDIPTAHHGDCYDRCVVRVEEIRQSLRIIRQCLENMPSGPYKADHPLTTPPDKARSKQDIETLIQHFVNMSWGPVIPPSEVSIAVEATKGVNSYYLVSDGSTNSYRTRIRTPSFPHLQMIPLMSRGLMVADLIAIIASIDFVMADVDR